jgi:peptide/nickel transport system ATP-binding protein
MYRGRVVERGPADDVILNPQHAYTQLLALATHDPERPGKLIGTSAVDRQSDTVH